MDNQELMDLIALSMPDTQMLRLFEKNRKCFEAGHGDNHLQIMRLIVQAIDNTYGAGSFALYKDKAILPSDQ